jgi:GNAT superfamily N-acetyltransferase
MTLTVRRFAPDEWRLYRDLRLHALEESPNAFGSIYAHEVQRTDEDWALRLSRGATSPRDQPLVAEVNGEPSGLAWARCEEAAPAIVHLYQMWVVPGERTQGVGRALLGAAVDWSRAVGAEALVLDVTIDNTPARRLYERAGFVPIGDPKPLRPGSTVQSQAMRLALTGNAAAPSA